MSPCRALVVRCFFVLASAVLLLAALVVLLQLVPVDLSLGNLVIRSQQGATHPMAGRDQMVKMAAAASRLSPSRRAELDLAGVRPPKNLIIVVGDGMGLGQLSTTSSLLFGPAGGLAVEGLRAVGLTRLWALDELQIDSAAAGTAIASGFRTNKAMVGMLPDGRRVKNLFEAARQQGLATAVVTTSYLTDATPACFTAHAASRTRYAAILDQMLDSGTEILLGGDSMIDWRGDAPTMAAVVARLADRNRLGYTLVTDVGELAAARAPILGLFASRNGDPSYHGPALAVSTRKVLEELADRAGGFAALIESEITDAAGHANDIAALVAGARELDEATRVVLDFAEERDDTLVLVIADHSTGAPGIVGGDPDDGIAHIRWLTNGHTAHWVPCFAAGPGAEAFTGVFDAAQIGPTIGAVMGFDDYPAVLP